MLPKSVKVIANLFILYQKRYIYSAHEKENIMYCPIVVDMEYIRRIYRYFWSMENFV